MGWGESRAPRRPPVGAPPPKAQQRQETIGEPQRVEGVISSIDWSHDYVTMRFMNGDGLTLTREAFDATGIGPALIEWAQRPGLNSPVRITIEVGAVAVAEAGQQ